MALHDLSSINSVVAYPHEYLVEEDQMGDSRPQDELLDYLKQVLKYLFSRQGWMVARSLNFYHPAINNSENLIVPDMAVFKEIDIPSSEQDNLSSWDMMDGKKPCPPWVFESSSKSTYANDILDDRKPKLYGLIGVQEYFAYDPNTPRVWPQRLPERLIGWEYDASGKPNRIKPDNQGRLWSKVLEHYLVADGLYVRILDRDGNVRFTQAEAETKRADAEKKRADELQRLLDELRRNQASNN